MDSTNNSENKPELTKNRIIHYLRCNPGSSRQQCALALSVSTFTVSRIVGELLQKGVVYEHEGEVKNDAPGRPGISLYLNPNFSCFAGIEFDTQYWRFVVVNFSGELTYTHVTRFPLFSNQIEFVDVLNRFLNEQITLIKKKGIDVESFCIGAPGFIDRENGCIKSYELLPFFKEIPLIKHVSINTDIPIYITHNIFNLAYNNSNELDEYRDKSVIHIVVRSGISACLSNSMKPFIGNHYLAGEIGLTDIGQGVFLQDIASTTALQRLLPNIDKKFWEGDEQSIQDVYTKNKKAHHILKRATFSIARVLGNIQAFADSDIIVVYCPFMKKNSALWKDFSDKFYQQLEVKGLCDIKIVCIDDSEVALAKSSALFCMEYQYPRTIDDLKARSQYLLKKKHETEGSSS